MYDDENILCEYDLECDQDFGDGMTDAQLDILADVREAISRGIEEIQNTRRRSELYEKEGSPKRKETRRVQNEILWLPCIR